MWRASNQPLPDVASDPASADAGGVVGLATSLLGRLQGPPAEMVAVGDVQVVVKHGSQLAKRMRQDYWSPGVIGRYRAGGGVDGDAAVNPEAGGGTTCHVVGSKTMVVVEWANGERTSAPSSSLDFIPKALLGEQMHLILSEVFTQWAADPSPDGAAGGGGELAYVMPNALSFMYAHGIRRDGFPLSALIKMCARELFSPRSRSKASSRRRSSSRSAVSPTSPPAGSGTPIPRPRP